MEVEKLLENLEERRNKYMESIDELMEYAAKTDIPFCTISYNPEEAVGSIHCSIHKGKTLKEVYYDIYDMGDSHDNGIYVHKKDDSSVLTSLLNSVCDSVRDSAKVGGSYVLSERRFYEQIKDEPNGFEEEEEVPLAEYCSRKPNQESINMTPNKIRSEWLQVGWIHDFIQNAKP